MAWIYLTVAGLFEIGWAIEAQKYTDGFTRLLPSLWTIVSMIASIVLLGLALKTLPVGTAYAVWTGIGAVGTAALGIYLFANPATALRLICIGLILSSSSVSGSRRLRATESAGRPHARVRTRRRHHRGHVLELLCLLWLAGMAMRVAVLAVPWSFR